MPHDACGGHRTGETIGVESSRDLERQFTDAYPPGPIIPVDCLAPYALFSGDIYSPT